MTLALTLYAAVRGCLYAGLLLLIGMWGARRLVGRTRHHLDDVVVDRFAAQLRSAFPVIAASVLALILAKGALQVWSLRDPDDGVTRDLIEGALLSGGWAHAWMLEGIAALLLIVASASVRSRSVATLLIAAVLWGQSGTGHAATNRWPFLVGRALDSAHLAGAGLWLGTLAVLAIGLLPALRTEQRLPALARVIQHFSLYARVGVLTVIATGIIATLRYTPSVALLLHSAWGQLLIAKLICLLAVLALGWYNWRVVTPALDQGLIVAPARLRRAVWSELAVGVIVLAITALLVVQSLPGEQ